MTYPIVSFAFGPDLEASVSNSALRLYPVAVDARDNADLDSDSSSNETTPGDKYTELQQYIATNAF